MFDLGGGELLLIVLAVLVLFGPKKLPELAQSLGRGMREFKRAQREFTEQINQAVSDESYKKKATGRELSTPDGSVGRAGSSRTSAPRGVDFDAPDAPPSDMTLSDTQLSDTHLSAGSPSDAPPPSAPPPGTPPSDVDASQPA